MPELRDVLEQLAGQAPPARDRFDEELWERVHARELGTRRRRRIAMVAAATVAIAAAGATGVFALRGTPAGTTVDRTIACRLTTTLASAGFYVGASVTEPGPYGAASVWVGTSQATFAGAGKRIVPAVGAKATSGYYFDDGDCTSTHTKVRLSQSGLRSLGAFSRSSKNADIRESCSVASNSSIAIRLRVVLARPGVASSAQLAILGGKHPYPLAFVTWTPTRFTAYAAAACVQS
jgi:hypothetical protein